jgi:subtilisin family serine protease
VYDTLTAHALASQASLRNWLDVHAVRYVPFWIDNSLYVYGADAALVRELAVRSDVARVRVDRPMVVDRAVSTSDAAAGPDTLEWNIEQIHADEVWAHGDTGEGVVIANLDTGVRYTHEALRKPVSRQQRRWHLHARLQLVGPASSAHRTCGQLGPRHASDGHRRWR